MLNGQGVKILVFKVLIQNLESILSCVSYVFALLPPEAH